jgi:hypothetical protein
MEQEQKNQEPQTQLKTLKYHFNDAEITEFARNLADQLKEQSSIELEKSSANAMFKQQLTSVEENVSRLRDKIFDGYEHRDVHVEIKFHFPEQNQKTWTNPFSGEEVTEEMNNYDHNLFNQYEEPEIDESELEATALANEKHFAERDELQKKGKGRKKKSETSGDTF